jgi:predicted esterase
MESSAFAQSAPAAGEFARDIAFDQPFPLAKNSVLLERLMSPRQRGRQLAAMAAKGEALAPYPLDFSAERFSFYLPNQMPTAGYGLLVFIPPWEDARLPQGWAPVLNRAGVIFATAERSGNPESIVGRRIPLAVNVALALAERYRVDPNRTYIGGFSGGSRVAMRAAIAFPDIFAGVLLNSGSDPIGNDHNSLPSPELMALLQTRTRFVFATGENDDINLSKDAETRISLSRWCVDAARTVSRPHAGHQFMDDNGLAEALGALDRPFLDDPARLNRCRASTDARLQVARAQATALYAQPQNSRIQEQLDRLDREFGALLEQPTAPAPTSSH